MYFFFFDSNPDEQIQLHLNPHSHHQDIYHNGKQEGREGAALPHKPCDGKTSSSLPIDEDHGVGRCNSGTDEHGKGLPDSNEVKNLKQKRSLQFIKSLEYIKFEEHEVLSTSNGSMQQLINKEDNMMN